MPPPSEPYRMANAGNAEPLRDGHGIVFRRPYAVFRNVMLKAEPIRAGRAVPPPIKTRMIGEDLNPCPDDEHHQEEIEEMQQTQPQRETRVHRLRGWGASGIVRDEFLHAGHRTQLLGYGDPKDQ